MIFHLKYDRNLADGAFFYDKDFGSYFITSKTNILLKLNECDLIIEKDLVKIDASNSNYKIHRIEKDDLYIYIFIKKTPLDLNIEHLTLDSLSITSDFPLFTGGDVLEYLADVRELANGNFMVGSVEDYIKTIETLANRYPNKEHFFRGHYYYKYLLVPSLYRKKKYYDNESYMYMDFKTQFYNELSNKKYIEILTTMQHYKMPTRLLDTTSNPLVALYMACDIPYNYHSKNYGIGEVVFMSEDRKNVKYSDSNTTILLSSLAVLETPLKQELYEAIKESIKNKDKKYQETKAYKRFVGEVTSELSGFDETYFDPESLLKPRHVKVGMINERIIAQSGNFILFGLCNYQTGEYEPLNTVSKERIFIVHRDYISKQLNMLNINAGTMYPDKDHMSIEIMKSYDNLK